MKFTTDTHTLFKQLQVVINAIPQNNKKKDTPKIAPIYNYLLLTIKDNTLTITASNPNLSISTKIDVENTSTEKTETSIAVHAKQFIKLIQHLPIQPLQFECNTQKRIIEIKCLTGEYKLTAEQANIYPTTIQLNSEHTNSTIQIPINILTTAIPKTIFAAGTDEMRIAMKGLRFDFQENEITFAATDANKLVKLTYENLEIKQQEGFTINSKNIKTIQKILTQINKPKNETPVTITHNNTNTQFTFNNTTIICRLIDANFPNYNAVIPTTNTETNILNINRNDLIVCLKRLVLFTNKVTQQVNLKLTNNKINFEVTDLDSSTKATETITCNYTDCKIEIAYNAQFLIDMLKTIETEEVIFQIQNPKEPTIILPNQQLQNQNLLMLIMPIRLS